MNEYINQENEGGNLQENVWCEEALQGRGPQGALSPHRGLLPHWDTGVDWSQERQP